jgi:hypothetical protein
MNSLRLGLVHEDNIYGKPTIFLVMGSQTKEAKNFVKKYIQLNADEKFNIIAVPFDHEGSEPGDNYEIYTYYENVLGIKFYVTEKLSIDHVFFKDFGIPEKNFTEYHFDSKTKFIGKF